MKLLLAKTKDIVLHQKITMTFTVNANQDLEAKRAKRVSLLEIVYIANVLQIFALTRLFYNALTNQWLTMIC